MKTLRFFDSHCDTAYELYHRGVGLDENNCHVSLSNAVPYSQYAQYYAVWSNRRLDDETCWQDFLRIAEYFDRDIERLSDKMARVSTGNELATALEQGKHAAILAVEDARLIAGDLARLDILHGMGVRYLTLLWGGNSCIGGSHDTENGLTELGKQTVRRCFELGIIPDVSHASERSTDDILDIATQYGRYGIRCNGVAPGLVLTPAAIENLTPEQREAFTQYNSLPYAGKPEDIAAIITFLASDDARYISGQTIIADGGMSCHNPTAVK